MRFALALLSACALLHGAAPPELAVQTGHVTTVYHLAFSPDGRTLASGAGDARVILWDVRSGKQLRTLAGNAYDVARVAWSRDGRHIEAVSDGICVFDAHSGELRLGPGTGTLAKEGWLSPIMSPTGDRALVTFTSGQGLGLRCIRLADGGQEWEATGFSGAPWITARGDVFIARSGGQFHIHAMTDGRRLRSFAGTGEEFTYAFRTMLWGQMDLSPDGRLLAAACTTADKSIRIRVWDIERGVHVQDLTGAAGSVLAFSPDGRFLAASGNHNNQPRVWRIDGWQAVPAPPLAGEWKDCAFSSDGALVAVCFDMTGAKKPAERPVHVLSTVDGAVVRILPADDQPVTALAFGPGDVLATGRDDGSVRLWEGRSGRPLATLAAIAGDISLVRMLDNLLITDQGAGCTVFDLSRGRPLRVLPVREQPLAVADGAQLVLGLAADSDRRAVLLDAASGTTRASFDLGFVPTALAIDASAQRIAASRYIRPQEIACLASDGRKLWRMPGEANGLAFSRDGSALAIGQGKRLLLVNAVDGKPIREFAVEDSRSIAFSPDGRLLAAPHNRSDAQAIRIFDLADGRLLKELKGHTWITQSLAFSPDGTRLVSADMDATVRLWDVAAGTCLHVLRGHGFKVRTAAFSPDGRWILSGGADSVLRIWDAATGAPVARQIQLDDGDFVLALPDARYAASAGVARGVAFAQGMDAFPFEQFDVVRNQPDAVLAALGRSPPPVIAAYNRARSKRLGRLGIAVADLEPGAAIPTCTLRGDLPVSTASKRLAFELALSDPASALDRLELFVNDVPVYGQAGLSLRGQAGLNLVLPVDLMLSDGTNKIQAAVRNRHGARSLLLTRQVVCTAPSGPGKRHVIAIGVSDYADDEFDLDFAASDATNVAAAFALGTTAEQTVLTDRQVTRAAVLALRSRLMATAVDDTVVLFVAGHGLLDSDLEYWFAPHDTDFADPSTRGIAYAELEGLLDGIPARNKLLLMDTCHGGEVDKDAVRLVAATAEGSGEVRTRGFKRKAAALDPSLDTLALMRELFADLRRGSGAVVVTSAAGAEVALESPAWKGGVFSYALVQALRDPATDRNNDGALRVGELRDRLIETVRGLTQGRQSPTGRQVNLSNDFVLRGAAR